MRIINGKPYYTEAELSRQIGRGIMTLFRWRKSNTGPKAIKIGRTPLYAVAEVDAWIERGGQKAAA
jgi:predicted DNA-binding transcriptional regulator AlpA